MTFHPLEDEIINGFDASRPISSEWEDSPLKELLVAAPATNGRFAREIIERLAAAADVTFGQVPGHSGSRVRVGSAACEIKFSTEDAPRFQQVRLPSCPSCRRRASGLLGTICGLSRNRHCRGRGVDLPSFGFVYAHVANLWPALQSPELASAFVVRDIRCRTGRLGTPRSSSCAQSSGWMYA